ncbi:alpha/beta fold hydrolase [Sphingomicrobium nitratireducens]|uniref:alpha/beta fold hydrolase n=1 Tax=Sphingomicrobium nitratireducens TaxID=2964666 RepID=UPI00223F6082|nr:alpha/beta hydrolase [Sphingomicrobium nitratireducens]
MIAFALAATLAAADPACRGGMVDVGDYGLHTTIEGEGPVAVVFESGNGNDGTVWADMAARLAGRGYTSLRYDRAGLGQSAPRPGDAYDVDNEVAALRGLMDRCGVEGPVLIVAHSYGGMIATLMAARDPRVKALLMLDATNAGTENPARIEKLLTLSRARYQELRDYDRDLAAHIIPLMEAWGDTAAKARAAAIPDEIPIYLLVRGIAGSPDDDLEEWQSGMAAFAAGGPRRYMVVAPGMGHKVAAERPDWVEASALQLLDYIERNAD